MAWLRVGDTFSTDPRILALNNPGDPLMGPACRGFFLELATLSANAFTDYVVTEGFINLAGGPAAPVLLKRCVRAGLVRPMGGRGAAKRWRLIDDAPELIHLRLKAEVTWEKQQKADTRNDLYRLTVLLRDGDACRYCGVVVQPYDTKSGRGRTIDHVRSDQTAARSAEDLVVCCRSCNSKRGRDWQDEDTRGTFAARWPLLPIPSPLIFVRRTVDELEDKGHTIPPGSVVTEKAKDLDHHPTTSGQDATHHANQARVAAPARSTTASDDLHPTSQVGVATPDAGTTSGATRPASQAGAAAPQSTADQHPASQTGVAATADNPSAPECQHPAPAGVAVPESRIDRSVTDRSGSGRARDGSVVGSGGSPPTRASPAVPTDRSITRRTRRGRRRTTPGGSP